jgi:hypothetical protein
VAGQEQRSEQRLEGQPEYLGVSRLHLRRLRALTTGTPPTVTDIHHTDIQAMGTEPTRRPAMDFQDTPVLPLMLVLRAMGTRADLGSRITPLHPATDIPASRKIPLTSVRRATNTRSMKVILLTQVRQDTDHRAIWDAPLTLVSSLTGIRTVRFILPAWVPVLDILGRATPAITPQRSGRLARYGVEPFRWPLEALVGEPGTMTGQNRMASDWPTLDPGCSTLGGVSIGSFTLAVRPSRCNLAMRPAKSGMPGECP